MRIRRKGSDGGQKGIRSIIEQLGSEDFIRIKLGVGIPPDPANMINWVLGVMEPEDAAKFAQRVNDVPGAVETLIGGDVDSPCKIQQLKEPMNNESISKTAELKGGCFITVEQAEE